MLWKCENRERIIIGGSHSIYPRASGIKRTEIPHTSEKNPSPFRTTFSQRSTACKRSERQRTLHTGLAAHMSSRGSNISRRVHSSYRTLAGTAELGHGWMPIEGMYLPGRNRPVVGRRRWESTVLPVTPASVHPYYCRQQKRAAGQLTGGSLRSI